MSPLSGYKKRPDDPVLGLLWDMRRDIHHLALATLGLFLALVVAAVVTVFVRSKDVDNRIIENRKAILYMCATRGTVDDLVEDAVAGFKSNLDNGVYEQLESQGALPKGSTDKARASLAKYQKAHAKLQNRKPCKQVE